MSKNEQAELPHQWFRRVDETADEAFYAEPRFVAHIDQAPIDALTAFYREFIPPGARVLDLMSSWISHLPTGLELARVAGLGMNEAELAANPQLTDHCVHNLNEDPKLPYGGAEFDRVTLAVSIQYLIRPIEVMSSVHDVLADGGAICIAMSHRLFPTKAILAFQELGRDDRLRLVSYYLSQAGFDGIQLIDRSPANADPLWLVIGHRSA
jgi:SAM-dependent methyltransferase